MSTKLFPVASILVNQGNVDFGTFIGLSLGPGLVASGQGDILNLDASPVPGPPGPVGPVGPPGPPGPPASYPVSDAIFAVKAVADPTKLLNTDVSGQAPGTATTIFCTGTLARSFRLPDFNGTALVAQDVSGLVLIGQNVQDQGSNSGIQYSTLFTSRAMLRTSQYGANAGIPGLSSFKSRGATIGSLAACVPGDVLWRMTAAGVTGDGTKIPLAALLSVNLPASGIFAQSLSPDFEFQLAKDTINSRRVVWNMVGLTGDWNMALAGSRVRLKEGANAMQGAAALGAGGTVTVANTLVTANTRILFSIQEGAAPLGTLYVSARVPGASFTISSTNAADVCNVAWQLWEPAP